jgi:hypothetical protein
VGVVLLKLSQAVVDHVFVFDKVLVAAFHLPHSLQLFDGREGVPERRKTFGREIMLDLLGILV